MSFRIGLVVSRFNEEFTKPLLDGALARLKELDFRQDDVTVVWVPGAVEIPLIAQKLAKQGVYEAIVALGVVIQGDTKHFDYVCSQVSDGCQRVALDNDIPVIFGVLTTNDEEQTRARIGGAHGHKGRDAVNAAVEMVSLIRKI